MTIIIKQAALLEHGEDIKLKEGVLIPLYQLVQNGYSLATDLPYQKKLSTNLKAEYIAIDENYGGQPFAIISLDVEGSIKLIYKDNEGIEYEADNWMNLVKKIIRPERVGMVERKTSETDINVRVNLDGNGKSKISTGLGFFDHMLEQIAKHGNLDLELECKGDLHIDEHHTIEDTSIALGEALLQAIGNKRGIERYASVLPMDETQAMVALDLSGRPYLVFEAEFTRDKVGDFPTEMTKHFFYSLAMATKSTLHIEVKGENDHHKIEAIFKGFAVALKNSVKRGNSNRIPSSKGIL